MKTVVPVTLFICLAFILGKGISPSSYTYSRLETHKIFLRSQYFGEGLGKVYENRFGVYYFDKVYPLQTKLQSVFFSSLNPALVFLPIYGFLLFKGLKKSNEN